MAAAGIYSHNVGVVTIENNTIVDNTTGGGGSGNPLGGGGISGANGPAVIRDNTISHNYGAGGGGGVACWYSAVSLSHNLISANTTDQYGGALSLDWGSSAALEFNTIASNSAALGNAISATGDLTSPYAIPYRSTISPATGNIVWGNSGPSGWEIYLRAADLRMNYSDVPHGEGDVYGDEYSLLDWGPGMIDANPFFADAAHGDYHLMSTGGRYDPASGLPPLDDAAWVCDALTSPCIDAGDPASPYSDKPSPNGSRVNMGAYGNTSEASKTDPRPPTLLLYTLSDDTGTPASVQATMDNTPVLNFLFNKPIYGTNAGVSVTNSSGGSVAPSAVAGWGINTLTVTFSTPLPNDVYTVTLSSSNIADLAGQPLSGNQPNGDDIRTFTIDTIPDARTSEGDTFVYTGLCADPSPYAWTAMVDYGDGSGLQPLAINPDLTFDLHHVYTARGTYTLTVSLDDGHGRTRNRSAVVNVFGPVVYVDANATGANSGTTWPNASTDLQRALALAEPGQQVWIADGLYKPGTAPGDTFALESGVSIYGGFLGGEQSLSQRDPRRNPPSILSGDIGGGRIENNCCVVTAVGVDASTVLDGLTITAGYRALDGALKQGGGIFGSGSSLTISNCVITGNAGGIYVAGGSPAILNNEIEGNTCYVGAGIACSGDSVLIAGNLISGNRAYWGGAGIRCAGSVTIENNTIVDNTAGGGPWSASGGGVVCVYANAVIRDNTISHNDGAGGGGGLNCINYSHVSVSNNLICANTTNEYGGAIRIDSGSLVLEYNTIAGNSAGLGNAIYATDHAAVWPATGNILWGNSGTSGWEIYLENARLTMDYSDVPRGEGGVYADDQSVLASGPGMIDVDPLFADPAHGDYHLMSNGGRYDLALGLPPEDDAAWVCDALTSPCIDAGDPAAAYSNEPAPNGGRVNLGTYGNTDQASKTDTRPPTANIVHVIPDPRTTAVGGITIVFTEPVSGFDLADLKLKRNGGANLLTSGQTLTTSDNITWTLGNLSGLTGTLVGSTTTNYVLTLTAAGSGITDLAGNPLTADASDVWVLSPPSTFTGTPNADTFEFIAAGAVGGLPTMHQLKLTLAGSPVVTYLYDASGSVALTLRGGGGNDTLRITGGPGMDTSSIYRYAILHVGPAAAGSAGYYSVYAPYADGSFETMVVDGGAGTGQRATLYNGPASGDHFTASSWLRTGSMVGTGTGNVYNNSVKNFDQIYGASTGGGTDARANLSDSNGNDFFVCKTEGANAYSVMQRVSGGTGSAAYLWAGGGGFSNVYGYSTAGGTDEAVLNGSSGNDTAVFQPQARRVRDQGRRRLLRIRLGLQEGHGLSRAGHRRQGLPARDRARRHVHRHRGHGTALGDDPFDGRVLLEHRRGWPARRALGQGLWPGQLPWHDRRCRQGVPERHDRRRRAHRGRQAARDHLGRGRGERPVDGDRLLDPGAGVPAGLRRHEDRQRHGEPVRLHRRGSRAVLGREEGAQHGAERRGAERRHAGPCQRQPHCRPQLLLQGHRFGQQRE